MLRGLLARDPSARWQWPQLNRWLEGETVDAPASGTAAPERHSSQGLTLGGHSYFRADEFALAAAEHANWEEGRALGQRGGITTWAEQSRLDPSVVAALRRAALLEGIPEDHRHALLLQTLNPDLPFSLRGDIVTPDWLLKNPLEAYEILSAGVIGYLRHSGRERWLVQVADRIQRMRDRAQSLEIVLDEERFRIACLASSRPRYQKVRRRVPTLPQPALACLRLLRRYAEAFSALPRPEVGAAVSQTLARESRLAWKERIEQTHPSLLLDRDSLSSRTNRLEELDGRFVKLNRELIAADSGLREQPSASAWEAVTRLTGPRARRLREFFDAGIEIGLLGLRPVWLMNPDVASRVLPLRAGLFDVVVFDEASQIPVEHALPSLYRAKRVVVSGDEKQMPPTSFFSSRLKSDEDELFDADEIDDAVTDSARAELEDKWKRREIKDCEDLLTLARTCLPATMLEIHYRSNFRELINFSNAAYYSGDLYVPVQNPEERVRRDPPIIVHRVNGTYWNCSNRARRKTASSGRLWVWRANAANRERTCRSL